MRQIVRVIIPAINEEKSIGKVLNDIPKQAVEEVIVVDNGSKDKTVNVAENAGATVLIENEKGYGSACLTGMNYISSLDNSTDIVVFLDGDYSDYPQELLSVIQPILDDEVDFVIGSRALGEREKNSMTIPQVFGNWLATRMIRILYSENFTDLGPFRAIRWNSLLELKMKDRNYGWTAEMQVKAARKNLRCVEVPVNYRQRIGVSKVSGTIKGTIMAGYKIIFTVLKYSV